MSQTATIAIEQATATDLSAILRLLGDHHLPLDGIADHLVNALILRAGNDVVGSVALEMYGSSALLRSLAVAPGLSRAAIGAKVD